MKIPLILLLLLALASTTARAQQLIKLSFEKGAQTLQRSDDAVSYPIIIKTDSIKIGSDTLNLYTVSATVNKKKTTLPSSDYNLEFNSVPLDEMPSEYTFFLTLEGDTLADRDRVIYLDLELKKEGETTGTSFASDNSSYVVTVEGAKELERYNYLGYIGTNFDLIDGVRAKDLFFAINILAPPREKNSGFGFNVTLYGNRTLSTTDTSGAATYTAGYEPIGGDTVAYYTAQAQKTIISVSDNLGAMFTPLIRIWKPSDPKRQTQLYYAPQLEFIWRRKETTTSYINSVITDTTYRANRPITSGRFVPAVVSIPSNVYDMYLGLAGLFLKHENEHISVRVQASFGYNFSYIAVGRSSGLSGTVTPVNSRYNKEENWFTYARTWITEPKSGITFGAEVSNFVFDRDRYRPYYNVTLSKAIYLNALGAIFAPITAR